MTNDRFFPNHEAKLIEDNERFTVIDWKDKSGSNSYYVNYILDKEMSSLIVRGDLGNSIATWYGYHTVQEIANWIYKDYEYYLSKLQASTNKYAYDKREIVRDIKKFIGDDVTRYFIICQATGSKGKRSEFESESDFWKAVQTEIDNYTTRFSFLPSEKLVSLISGFSEDTADWLPLCGRETHLRVKLWAIGLYKACEQLGLLQREENQ